LTDVRVGILIVSSYLFIVLSLREWIRRRGKGFELKPVVLVHNLCQLLLSLYMFVETARQVIIQRYSLIGNPIDESSAGYGSHSFIYITILQYFSSVGLEYFSFPEATLILPAYGTRQFMYLCMDTISLAPSVANPSQARS